MNLIIGAYWLGEFSWGPQPSLNSQLFIQIRRKSMDIWIWGYMDIWIFNESFKFRRIFVEISGYPTNIRQIFVKYSSICCRNLRIFVNCLSVLGSLPPPRGLCACLRRFGDLRKTRPWNLGACILWIQSNFHRFVPPTTPWSMCLPAALRRPQKKHDPGFLEHVSCGFSQFSSILGSPKWYETE